MRATVVHLITLLELGGAQEITLFACRHLDRSRWRVHLVCGRGGLLDDEALAIPDLAVHFEESLVREVRPGRDVRCLRALARRLADIRRRSGSPLIVHTHSSKAGILGRWAARIAGADVVVHSIHGFGFHPRQPWAVRRAFQMAEEATARVTDAFCADSAANLERARELGLLSRGQPGLVAPCGIAARDYAPLAGEGESLRAELGVPAGAPLVGMIACLKPQKAPVDFVRVAARVAERLPEARFFVAGDGALRPEMEAEIARLGLGGRFRLLGWRRDIRGLLGALDVAVLTSLWEGLPRVCMQAMAARRPIVASRVDGVPEAVADGVSGFLLEPHDVEGFAERIARLLDDPALARAMGEEGFRRLGPYDSEAMLRNVETLYEELLDAHAVTVPAAL